MAGRAIIIVAFLLFGLPMIGIFVLQLVGTSMVYGTMSDVSEEMNEGTIDPFEGGLEVTNVMDLGHYNPAYSALADLSNFNKNRTATITTYVPMSDLLDGDEELPDENFYDVLVQARAPQIASLKCDYIIETFAQSCKLQSVFADIDSRSKAAKVVKIRAILEFVQREDFGKFDSEIAYIFEDIGQNLLKPQKDAQANLSNVVNIRKRIYRKVLSVCKNIRDSEDNCAISAVTIHTDRKRGTSNFLVTGKGSFAVLKEDKSRRFQQ